MATHTTLTLQISHPRLLIAQSPRSAHEFFRNALIPSSLSLRVLSFPRRRNVSQSHRYGLSSARTRGPQNETAFWSPQPPRLPCRAAISTSERSDSAASASGESSTSPSIVGSGGNVASSHETEGPEDHGEEIEIHGGRLREESVAISSQRIRSKEQIRERIALERQRRRAADRKSTALVRTLTWALRGADDVAAVDAVMAAAAEEGEEVNARVVSSVLQKLGIERQVGAALALFHWLQRASDNKVTVGDAQESEVSGHAETKAEVELKWKGLSEPNVYTYNSLLGALKASGEWRKMEEVAGWMSANGVAPDVVTLNTLLAALETQGKDEAAWNLLEKFGIHCTSFHKPWRPLDDRRRPRNPVPDPAGAARQEQIPGSRPPKSPQLAQSPHHSTLPDAAFVPSEFPHVVAASSPTEAGGLEGVEGEFGPIAEGCRVKPDLFSVRTILPIARRGRVVERALALYSLALDSYSASSSGNGSGSSSGGSTSSSSRSSNSTAPYSRAGNGSSPGGVSRQQQQHREVAAALRFACNQEMKQIAAELRRQADRRRKAEADAGWQADGNRTADRALTQVSDGAAAGGAAAATAAAGAAAVLAGVGAAVAATEQAGTVAGSAAGAAAERAVESREEEREGVAGKRSEREGWEEETGEEAEAEAGAEAKAEAAHGDSTGSGEPEKGVVGQMAGASRVLWLLHQMETVGIKADAETYRLALQACCLDDLAARSSQSHSQSVGAGSRKHGHHGSCRQREIRTLFAAMRGNRFTPDLDTCHQVIGALGRAKKWWAALEVFETMKAQGPAPTAATEQLIRGHFNILLTAARKRGLWRWAHSLLSKMESVGISPDAFAWRTVLVTCSKANETATAVRVFEDMVETGIRADAVAYGALLSALEKGDLLEPAETVWGHMRKMGVQPNKQAYTTMIVALGKRGEYSRAAGLFEELQGLGTISSSSSSISSGGGSRSRGDSAVGHSGEGGAVEELLPMHAQSGHGGAAGADVDRHRLGADVAAFNAMVTACAYAGEGLRALDWLQKMEASSTNPPNATTYQQAAIALADASHWEAALLLIPRARSRGIEPTPWTFEVVERACAANGADFHSRLAAVSHGGVVVGAR